MSQSANLMNSQETPRSSVLEGNLVEANDIEVNNQND